jgi:hypothetical protein
MPWFHAATAPEANRRLDKEGISLTFAESDAGVPGSIPGHYKKK